MKLTSYSRIGIGDREYEEITFENDNGGKIELSRGTGEKWVLSTGYDEIPLEEIKEVMETKEVTIQL